MKRFLLIMTLLTFSFSGWCQFYETPEEIPEENIYPAETYETDMESIQQEQDILYPEGEMPVDEYAEQDPNLYEIEEPAYSEE
jgi:hypothetical protein